jgi:kynurenine formamidase|tara:strand:- start:74 stop:883 length:810 start_codon:yes stop_codon:yes gene_type:complete
VIISISHNKKDYRIDTKNSFDISIPYDFNGDQPNFYDVAEGQLKHLQSGGTIYSVAEGAGCNVSEVSLNIHCSGTHTECAGHLLANPGDVGMLLKDIMIPTVLITVNTSLFCNSGESYHCNVGDNEQIITKTIIQNEFKIWEEFQPRALVIRTTPNLNEKKYYRYSNHSPPFFSNDALRFIKGIGICHLVVDLPSIDRIEDNGILGNHRIFWGDGVDAKGEVNTESMGTITELAYIENNIPNGFYFLNIQLPHFVCDAAPSRPILLKAD